MCNFIFLVSTFLLLSLHPVSNVEAENQEHVSEDEKQPSEAEQEDENINSNTNIAIEAQSFSDLFRSQSQSSFKGVILGNVIASTEDYLYVKPLERDLGRMYVYFDDKTLFSKMNNGKRQKGKKEYLIDGTRMAARVLVKEGIVLADEIFLVEDNFDPRSRYRKLSFVKKKSGEDKKEASSHGAAKPKTGGHH